MKSLSEQKNFHLKFQCETTTKAGLASWKKRAGVKYFAGKIWFSVRVHESTNLNGQQATGAGGIISNSYTHIAVI